jgi:hypothetical protein
VNIVFLDGRRMRRANAQIWENDWHSDVYIQMGK